MSESRPNTPVRPITKDPKITWAPMRKQQTFEPPTIVGDFQPIVLIPSMPITEGISHITNNLVTLNISKGK
jgi:hypothetical protein